jgi:MinD-like ATPase involved in chromosome partitioning or flagellar assembly
VASAGGGWGRTTLALTLGARLVRRGHRVRLVDSAQGTGSLFALPTIGAQVSVRARKGGHWSLGHDDLRLDGDLLGPRPGELRELRHRAEDAGEDRLLLDLPAGPNAALDLLQRADRPILLATPSRDAVDATVRLLSASVLRRAARWLRPRLGAEAAAIAVAEAQDEARGRAASLLRAVARGAGVALPELEAALQTEPWTLVLNQVRRADDIDVGALLADGAAALGVDLRFQGVIPWEDEAWIRARKPAPVALGESPGPWAGAVDDLLDRIDEDTVLPRPGGWRDEIADAALAGGASRSGW